MDSTEFIKHIVKLKGFLGHNKSKIAKELGCSRTMLYHYESGANTIPGNIARKILSMVANIEHDVSEPSEGLHSVKEKVPVYMAEKKTDCRMIRVIGMAHAGDPLDFEETPESWQESISTECRDRDAFGCKIIGDSMSPSFLEGDILVLMPNQDFYGGLFGVAKFKDGGVLFRRFNIEGEQIIGIPSNARYPIKDYDKDEFEWIYPVYESRRYLWEK